MTGPSNRLEAALQGDTRALAKILTAVERGGPEAGAILAAAFPAGGAAHVVGITGPPGAGKSTLVDGLIGQIRGAGHTVAALLVDPSSPFSGGAILGDRIRLQDRVSDSGVYTRSMASRGSLGGVSDAAPRAVAILDAAGFPYVIVETVGVGQAEVDIVASAHTTIVVLTPGWGDSIQAAKAGLLEIGDVFVVNKADRPGVEATVSDLTHMLAEGAERAWMPRVLTTIARDGTGLAAVWAAVEDHRLHLEGDERSGDLARRQAEQEIRSAAAVVVRERVDEMLGSSELAAAVEEVLARRVDPWTAARRLLGDRR